MKKISITIMLIMCIASICVVAEAAKNMGYQFPIADESKKITQYYSDGHSGIDIGGVKVGTPIYATKAGTVVNRFTGCTNYSRQYGTCKSAGKCSPVVDKNYTSNAYCNWGFGLGFIIRHNDGTWAEYAHMSSVADLKVGSTVEQGTYLGGVGSSGNSSGPHLHFGIRTGNVSSFWNATPLNPLSYMDLDDTGSHTHSYGWNYEAAHPHREYMKCSCGDYYYTGALYFNANYSDGYDAAHPHNKYKYCTICGYYDYSVGGTEYVSSCTTCNPPVADVPVLNSVTVSGTSVTLSWSASNNATSYDAYLVQSPWGWGDIKYSKSGITSTSYTFTDIAYGDYKAFIIARPQPDNQKQSNWKWANVEVPTHYVFYDAMGGSFAWGAQAITEDGGYLISATPTREGYTFMGWATTAGGEVAYGPQNRIVPTSNIYLYAVWKADYEISAVKLESYNGHTYVLYNETLSWEAAYVFCQRYGVHLATISSEDENTFVANFARDISYVWLGAKDSSEEGVWEWITGENFDYSNWATGEPNDENDEDYLMLYTNSGAWNDLPSNGGNRSIGFVLELDKVFSPVKTEDYQGHTYAFYKETWQWDVANLYCQNQGGHLATISSAEENEFVGQLASEEAAVWLGATDATEEGVWEWITGEAFDYSHWGGEEPNNTLGVENYLMLYTNSMEWNDTTSSAGYVTSFVCEYENEPEKPVVFLEKTEWSEEETIVMTWDSCEHADYYFPMAYDMDGNRVAVCWGTTDLAYSMNLPAGQYHLYVASVNDGSGKTIYGNAILITITEKYYTLTLDGNGGTPASVAESKRHNQDYYVTEAVPAKTGYTFASWNTKKDGMGDRYAVGDAFSQNQDTILYAMWQPITYTVVYHANGGTGTVKNTEGIYDKETVLAQNSYTKRGGKFIGWATTDNATTPTYTEGQNVKNLASVMGQTVTLYAVWAPVPYTTTTVTKYTSYALCHVSLGNMPQGKTLFVAGYLGDRTVFTEKRTTKNATEDFAVIGNADTVRVFVWDSVQGLVPVTEGETCVVQ